MRDIRRPAVRRSGVRGLALAAVTVLALSACGSKAPEVAPAPGVKASPCGTVTLAVNPWVGYAANAAVISSIARNELGCKVETRESAEADSWKQLAAGQVDAILENWGHDDLKKRYIDKEKVAVEAGLTGNKGVIGWYVPPWMKKAYPDITNWKNLNKYASLFKTAQSGSKGQLLDGDPTYVTNDKALVANLKLNFTVVYAGSEVASIAAFREAEKNHTPLLGYFYSPQWLLSELPLVHISLPAYTPGCDADLQSVKCDYQPFDLDKIENKKFAYSGSPAAELIQRFHWTTADQDEVARDITEGKLIPDAAARKWLSNHTDVWKAWLPPAA